jgi:hypothetical protein
MKVRTRTSNWCLPRQFLLKLKLKLKFFMCLINYHKDGSGSGGIAPPFLTSSLDEGERSVSSPDHFTAGEIDPGINLIRG